MQHPYIKAQASQDFSRAKSKAVFQQILGILRPEKKQLLSFYDIKSLVKPKSEIYRGMKAVMVSDIVGSEGRYHDFNQTFLPKKEHLRSRWTRVDMAYISDINLPPIRLYQIGKVYFVRDGNHRVSVARSQGYEAIDAEITELTTEIHMTPEMSREEMMKEVVAFERSRVLTDTSLGKVLPMDDISFTAPGRYDELLRHILGHKYYINEDLDEEITFEDAAVSWFENIYSPIRQIIRDQQLLSKFIDRTEGDLYVWIVKHWDNLKRKYGQGYPLEQAAAEYAAVHGKNRFQRFLHRLFRRRG